MHGRAHRKTVQLRGRAGMHTERQRVWAPSLMRSAVHQTLGGHTHTHTHTHTRVHPEPGGAQHGGDVIHPYRTVLSVFVYLWPITLFPSSHLTGPWSSPRCVRNCLLRRIPPLRLMGACLRLSCLCFLFDPQEAFLRMGRQGRLPWPQEWAPYLFALAELSFTTSFVLGVSGWEQKFSFTPLDDLVVWPRGPLSPTLVIMWEFVLFTHLCIWF